MIASNASYNDQVGEQEIAGLESDDMLPDYTGLLKNGVRDSYSGRELTMPVRQPKYSKEEAALRGDEIYARDVRSQVEPQHNGEVVAIDLDTGAWEVAPDEVTAARRLEAHHPAAQVWAVRVGSRFLTRFGSGRSKPAI